MVEREPDLTGPDLTGPSWFDAPVPIGRGLAEELRELGIISMSADCFRDGLPNNGPRWAATIANNFYDAQDRRALLLYAKTHPTERRVLGVLLLLSLDEPDGAARIILSWLVVAAATASGDSRAG